MKNYYGLKKFFGALQKKTRVSDNVLYLPKGYLENLVYLFIWNKSTSYLRPVRAFRVNRENVNAKHFNCFILKYKHLENQKSFKFNLVCKHLLTVQR